MLDGKQFPRSRSVLVHLINKHGVQKQSRSTSNLTCYRENENETEEKTKLRFV